MAASEQSAAHSGGWGKTARVIIVGSVAFSFIGYWRTAAVVLCDMSSTVYYIGAIVETAIGKAAPWFILAVLLFSYAMRSVYIESCAMFVRGGVYRVVKEAMGGFLAKLSVSALMFDYILTGPISGVSAGQYVIGLFLETLARIAEVEVDPSTRDALKSWGAVLIACAITLYFFRQNLIGIPESSDKALKIMIATTIMGVIMLVWCGVTLTVRGPVNDHIPWEPDLHKKVEMDEHGRPLQEINPNTGKLEDKKKLDPVTGEQQDPLGWLAHLPLADQLRSPQSWLSLIGVMGLIIAFGHSILAMSGEETLAQVYREVESPKLRNFKKAAFVVFLYSLLLTGTMNFLASLLMTEHQRLGEYYDNWMGGLAMQMVGPVPLLLLLNAFVVLVGFLILSGAVNTSIIGSGGVLSRVAEDGVLPDWFLKPHRRYGTNYRILYLVTGLQLFTIIASRGDVILLGEAYAFGVIWSFVFKTLSMVVLRFKDLTPRVYKVPFNVRIAGREIPIGLSVVCLIVLLSAFANLFTKQVATVSGMIFAAAFLTVFILTERYYEKRRRGAKHEHVEQFNQAVAQEITPASLELSLPYRKLVAIRSTQNLYMLDKALAETDPDTTDVVVMTAKVAPQGSETGHIEVELDSYDQHLMTAVVAHAERAGKNVKPFIAQTNNPLHAVLKTAKDLGVQELVMGASNKFTAEEQLDQITFYWINLHDGNPTGLTVRILSQSRDVALDVAGGNRIPKLSERRARSVAELRAAGVGVSRVLLVFDDSQDGLDLLQDAITMLDPEVTLDLAAPAGAGSRPSEFVRKARETCERLERTIGIEEVTGERGQDLIRLATEKKYDLILAGLPAPDGATGLPAWVDHVLRHAPCRVFLASKPPVPQEVVG